MLKPLHVVRLGHTPYGECLEIQRAAVAARSKGLIGDVLIFTEHDPVVTVGRAFKEDPASVELKLSGTPVFEVERGGKATYHGPGQLIGYPIVYLEEGERDLHLFLRKIEDALIDTLGSLSLRAEREPSATGVWVEVAPGMKFKVASIGIAVRRWVTFHGFALNVTTDLRGFEGFDPCGFKSDVMISLQHLLSDAAPSMATLEMFTSEHLARALGREATAIPRSTFLQILEADRGRTT